MSVSTAATAGARINNVDAVISNGGTDFTSAGSLGVSGGFGGGQLGCNYQAGAAVFGIETDFQGAGMSKSFGPTTSYRSGSHSPSPPATS